ncbi:MAG: hypothetical protein ACI311_01225 [Bacilli bacterium]
MKKLFVSSFIFFILIILGSVITVVTLLNINHSEENQLNVINEVIDDKNIEISLKENNEISGYLYDENLDNKMNIINIGIDMYYIYLSPIELVVENEVHYHLVKIDNLETISYFCINK